jgi:peptide/nickel transport system permease protein
MATARQNAFAPLAAFWLFMRRWPVLPAIVLSTLVISAIFAGSIAPYNPTRQDLRERLVPPAWDAEGDTGHLLGTDHVGRDVFSRLIHGARISLTVMAVAVVTGFIIGVTLGLIAGYFGGIIDEIISRIVDLWHALPFLLIALVVVIVSIRAEWGVSQRWVVIGLLALLAWSAFVRNIRAETMLLKEMEYIQFSKLTGASTLRIMFRHLLPGVFSTAIVIGTFAIGNLMLAEASLSFLGAGIPPPSPAWGVMITEGQNYIATEWWVSTIPGLAILLVVMSLNFLGDWLRDRLDPRLRQLN